MKAGENTQDLMNRLHMPRVFAWPPVGPSSLPLPPLSIMHKAFQRGLTPKGGHEDTLEVHEEGVWYESPIHLHLCQSVLPHPLHCR